MDKKEKDAIITRAAAYGINVRDKGSRTLAVVKKLIDYLEQKVDNYVRQREDLDNYMARYYTEMAISQATGLSRPNISRNATYKALIAAIKPPVDSEVSISQSEYQQLLEELETLREWRDNEALRQLKHADEMKAANTLIKEARNDAMQLQRLKKTLKEQEEKILEYEAIIKEQKLFIHVDSSFNGPDNP